MTRNIVPGCGIIILPVNRKPLTTTAQDDSKKPDPITPLVNLPLELPADGVAVLSPRSDSGQPNSSEKLCCLGCLFYQPSVEPDERTLRSTFSHSRLSSSCEPNHSSILPTSARTQSSAMIINMRAMFDINDCPPFKDPLETLGFQPYDVIKIKNVPFAVTIAEIKAFVGRLTTAPLIRDHQQGYPVHIIMERPTGKTMDCFVEFQHHGSAQSAVRRAEQTQFEGKILKMGTRHVEVEMSSEGELCAALFPRAKSVRWDPETGVPTVLVNQDPFSEGFQGFFTIEEMSSVCKHATTPQKSTFMQRCQQRVYESMISTLYKFPWHITKHYSVNTRNFLWSAYMDVLHNLLARVQPGGDQNLYGLYEKEVGLSHNLLLEYIFAGLNVQMFSLRQKFVIVHASGPLGPNFRLPRQAVGWPFQTLMLQMNWSANIVDEWLDVLDTGYQIYSARGLSHGHEKYLTTNRDESGFLNIEVTDAGRALSFHDLTSAELGLMEFLVEQGRQQWCSEYGAPYLPLRSQSTDNDGVAALETSMQSLQVARVHHRCTDEHSNASSDDYGSLVPNSPAEFSAAEDHSTPNEAYATHGLVPFVQTPSPAHFNPATPPFIPSQPWYGAGASTIRDNHVTAVAPTQPRAAGYSLSFALAPSWTSPQELPSIRRSSIGDAASPLQQQQSPQVNNVQLDQYNSNISPQDARRTSLQLARSVSMSPGTSDTIITGKKIKSYSESAYSNDGNGVVSYQTPQPVFGNVWGPTIENATSSTIDKNTHSLRRSVSGETPNTNSSLPRRVGSDPAVVTLANPTFGCYLPGPKTAPNTRTSSGGSAPIWTNAVTGKRMMSTAQSSLRMYATAPISLPPKPPPSNNQPVGWGFGSPKHGARSRSSTSRSFVPVQATINEEGDVSATDTVDGTDDANTDTGGVSLEAWNQN